VAEPGWVDDIGRRVGAHVASPWAKRGASSARLTGPFHPQNGAGLASPGRAAMWESGGMPVFGSCRYAQPKLRGSRREPSRYGPL